MMITSSTRLSKEETEELLKIKKETGTCISTLIREAVCFYLRETGHEPRTSEEEKLAIIAKQQDDYLFQEYEEVTSI
tara:strand:- start:4813 stop:5043 length:231 start_codon:yes stop_codon:yes gene_type:complete